jgi:hypothetical protein
MNTQTQPPNTHVLKTLSYKKINLLWKGSTNDQESFINSSCTFEWTWLEIDVIGSALNSSFVKRLLKRETSFNLKRTHNDLQTTHKRNYNCQCGLLSYKCSKLIMGLLPWRQIVWNSCTRLPSLHITAISLWVFAFKRCTNEYMFLYLLANIKAPATHKPITAPSASAQL